MPDHNCEEYVVEVGTSPDRGGSFFCWDECERCGRQFHHRVDSVA